MKIDHAKASDRQELLDFLHFVFSRNNPTHPRFEALYPDLFLEDDEVMGRHAIIRENGRIVSCVGTYLILMQLRSRRILTAGVGQVSTHPDCRGKGYMSALLSSELDRCRREGAVFAWLGGRRDRYSHFGFECAGVVTDYMVDKHSLGLPTGAMSVKHCAATDVGAITEEMFALRDRTIDSVIVPLDIFRMQMTRHGFNFEIWSATEPGNNIPAAWAVIDANCNRIQEWCGSFEGRIQILNAITTERGRLSVVESSAEPELSDFLRDHCVHCGPSSTTLAVLDRDNLVKAYGDLVPGDFQLPSSSVTGSALARAFFGPGYHSAELPFSLPGIFHI